MRKLMLLLVFLVLATPVLAQRVLPADAKRATTGESLPLPMVQINSDVLRLAPGGVIVDTTNRTITHGHLRPGAEILFQLDRNGDIMRIVVLTAPEQEQRDNAK